ncbi:MAG: XDD4 family exosortase-dependent surface protein [Verrucomicrobiia bacterium]|jgi:hypothetical protein
MKKAAMGLVALVLYATVGTAHGLASTNTGNSVTFAAKAPGNAPGKTLQASATFAVSNLDLIVTLSNLGTYDPSIPADILTAVFFKINGDPALTPVSAQLGPDASVIAHRLPLGFDGDVGGEWAYANDLANTKRDKKAGNVFEGISSASFNWFKANDLFPGQKLRGTGHPGGVDFGITTINDLYGNDSKGLKNQALIQAEVIFTLADLPQGFEYTDIATEISDVSFQYGTSHLKQPDILGYVEANGQVPEPSTISLVALGLLGALTLARRRMSRR